MDVERPVTPTEMLATAQQLLERSDAKTAGLWPRAAALLARQALGQGIDQYWRARELRLDESSTHAQLTCLSEYRPDRTLASEVGHVWHVLSRACHHHPYELAPTTGELRPALAATERVLRGLA
jgi:hypothetical protein